MNVNDMIGCYPSQQSVNHFGDCMVATRDLGIGEIVEKFITQVNEKPFNGDLAAPLDERHVVVIGKDSSGRYIYGKVLSHAKYINHSCDPNCSVNDEGEIQTLRPVRELEELTIGYDVRWGVCDKWESSWTFTCLCLAANCRKLIDSYKRQ